MSDKLNDLAIFLDGQIEKLEMLKENKSTNKKERGGKREGSGRPKGTNKPYLVRCHEKVIKDVRKYAKEQSEKYLEGLKKHKLHVHDTNVVNM